MGVNQYVYLALRSNDLSADQMAERLGMAPDERVTRGARSTEPPVPAAHVWRLVCRQPHMRIDEQAESVLGRVVPVVHRIKALTEAGYVEAVLQFVRYFDDDAPPARQVELVGENGPEVGPEPHDLLGFHLSAERLRLIADIGASIDCDEYAYRATPSGV